MKFASNTSAPGLKVSEQQPQGQVENPEPEKIEPISSLVKQISENCVKSAIPHFSNKQEPIECTTQIKKSTDYGVFSPDISPIPMKHGENDTATRDSRVGLTEDFHAVGGSSFC